MSFRGRGRGRGRGGFGGGFRPAQQVPFELFPEIEDLGTAEFSTANNQLVRWSWELQKNRESSPYYYEDRSQRLEKQKKIDIERFSDRLSQTKDVKRPLWHFIKLGSDHMPAELADDKRRAKKVKWTSGSDTNKLDYFEKIEQKLQGKEGNENKESEEEEEEDEVVEEDGEFSDEGDYEQAQDFDDDEDDFNMADDNDDEAIY